MCDSKVHNILTDSSDLNPRFYLREFDHINRVPALLPLFGFLITVGKLQQAVSNQSDDILTHVAFISMFLCLTFGSSVPL